MGNYRKGTTSSYFTGHSSTGRFCDNKSNLVYPEYFVSSNNIGLARYLHNRNRKYKEQNLYQSKCQQRKQRWRCAIQ